MRAKGGRMPMDTPREGTGTQDFGKCHSTVAPLDSRPLGMSVQVAHTSDCRASSSTSGSSSSETKYDWNLPTRCFGGSNRAARRSSRPAAPPLGAGRSPDLFEHAHVANVRQAVLCDPRWPTVERREVQQVADQPHLGLVGRSAVAPVNERDPRASDAFWMAPPWALGGGMALTGGRCACANALESVGA